MNAPQERRRLRRADRGEIPFLFLQDALEPLEAVAQDASIRSARFSLASRAQIEPYVAGHGEITFTQARTRFERLAIPPELIREDLGTFVVTYRTRQLSVGDTTEGRLAAYKILRFIGAGQSSETYEAEVISASSGATRLQVGDTVVLALPLFLPYLSDTEINDQTARLERLLAVEEANLTRVADLRCVAGVLDMGLHQFPREGAAATRFLVQRLVQGDLLDEYLRRTHANTQSGSFTGLPADAFYRLATLLGGAIQQVHGRIVIHGDIWPENIVMAPSHEPVLTGLSHAIFREAADPIVKVSGRHLRYLSPEAPRSLAGDVYSLGGVLHYLATGEDPPEPQPDPRVLLTAVLDRIRENNPELYQSARGVAEVIARCLSRSDRRYADVRTPIDRLDTFLRAAREKEDADVRAALDELVREGKPLDAKTSGLLRRLAVVRAHGLRDDLRDMGRGAYDVAGDPDTIAASFTQCLAFLGTGDDYLTISTPPFWRPGNPGMNGEFLSMNLMAAARGVTIRHLLVIPSGDLGSHLLDSVMSSHVDILREVKALAPTATFEVKVLFVPGERYDDLVPNHDLGLLVRKNEVVAVFPEYRDDGSVVAVRYRAGQNLVGGRKDAFRNAWKHPDALVLRKWPTALEIQERAYELYVGRGHRDGGDLDDFVRARRELIEESNSAPAAV